tara:strand:- start:1911 stop:2834 length:924 start_codon:yes stop_codon:yes gene_type:complete
MVIYKSLNDIIKTKETIVTIGAFDGLHKGHSLIFDKLESLSTSSTKKVVISFDPHPKSVFNPKSHKILVDKKTKIELIKKYKIDILLLVPFNRDFANQSADYFLSEVIVKFFDPKIILIGHDHCFGKNRLGNESFLKRNENLYNYKTISLKPNKIDGEIISSSIIKTYIVGNEIELANKFLGRKYSINGLIEKGAGRGRLLNYPTANLNVSNDSICIPSNGVYAINAKMNGNEYKGMCNIGHRPTFDDLIDPVIEVNLFHDFKQDFYGQKIEISFVKYIRKEKKFSTKIEFINQLNFDKKICMKVND